jgi:hypothetical protein
VCVWPVPDTIDNIESDHHRDLPCHLTECVTSTLSVDRLRSVCRTSLFARSMQYVGLMKMLCTKESTAAVRTAGSRPQAVERAAGAWRGGA